MPTLDISDEELKVIEKLRNSVQSKIDFKEKERLRKIKEKKERNRRIKSNTEAQFIIQKFEVELKALCEKHGVSLVSQEGIYMSTTVNGYYFDLQFY